MTNLNNTKVTSRLLKLFENGSVNQMGSLTKPDGSFTTIKQKNLDLIMTTHFWDCTLKDSLHDEPQSIFQPFELKYWEDIEVPKNRQNNLRY